MHDIDEYRHVRMRVGGMLRSMRCMSYWPSSLLLSHVPQRHSGSSYKLSPCAICVQLFGEFAVSSYTTFLMMRSAIFLSLLLLGVVGRSSAFSSRPCDGASPPFVPDKVQLTPENPDRGEFIHFEINGVADRRVESGTFSAIVYVKYCLWGRCFRRHVYDEHKDLCDRAPCPIVPGPVTFTYDRELPIITPPGNYDVRIEARDNDDTLLMCLVVNFSIGITSNASLRTVV